jgi:versiconal hemiacetal acetate esterase
VYKNASSLGADQSKIFTAGASAGGGLALTTADQVIRAGSQVKGIVVMVPVTAHLDSVPAEYKSEYTAYMENASGVPLIDGSTMKTFFEASAADPHDGKVFVTLSKDLAKFPKTYIATCSKDPLRDDGKILKMMLEKEGVATKHDFYEGVPHYFWMFPGIEGGVEFLDNVVQGLKWAVEG